MFIAPQKYIKSSSVDTIHGFECNLEKNAWQKLSNCTRRNREQFRPVVSSIFFNCTQKHVVTY